MTPLSHRSVLFRGLAVATVLVAAVRPPEARAQLTPSVELGYRQWTRPERTAEAPVASAALAGTMWRALHLAANGALALDERPTRLLGGRLAATLTLPTLLSVPALGWVRPELQGRVDRDPADTVSGRARVEGGARLALERRRGGLWVGAGLVRPPGGGEVGGDVGAGAWRAVGRAVVSATVRRRSGGGLVGFPDSGGHDMTVCRGGTYGSPRQPGVICAQRVATSDVEAAVRWRAGPADFDALVGRRLTNGAASVTREHGAWAAGSVAVPVTPTVTALAELRRLPADVARGLPERAVASFGVRLRPGPRRGGAPPASGPQTDAPRPAARAPSVSVGSPDEGGRRALRLVLPGARRVELRGDMTSWSVVTLEPAAGRAQAWEGRFALPDGVYHFAVRVDGGEWRVPPGVPAVDDGFGGEVGVLVVE